MASDSMIAFCAYCVCVCARVSTDIEVCVCVDIEMYVGVLHKKKSTY